MTEAAAGDLVTTRQAAALLTVALGRRVDATRVERVLDELAGAGEIAWKTTEGEWRLSSATVDLVEGELWRRSMPWWRRAVGRNVFRAWVEGLGGERRLLALPYAWRARGVVAEREGVEPDELPLVVWPTGRLVGRLVRVEDGADGVPVYEEREEGAASV